MAIRNGNSIYVSNGIEQKLDQSNFVTFVRLVIERIEEIADTSEDSDIDTNEISFFVEDIEEGVCRIVAEKRLDKSSEKADAIYNIDLKLPIITVKSPKLIIEPHTTMSCGRLIEDYSEKDDTIKTIGVSINSSEKSVANKIYKFLPDYIDILDRAEEKKGVVLEKISDAKTTITGISEILNGELSGDGMSFSAVDDESGSTFDVFIEDVETGEIDINISGLSNEKALEIARILNPTEQDLGSVNDTDLDKTQEDMEDGDDSDIAAQTIS